ncbi:MAG: hypothetical protein KatS3mg028_0830 [Bacteroidia bacterium]|nr:MAG: hypothetical protein KatS3mg028_0830 [Bacteroidia bacterium]
MIKRNLLVFIVCLIIAFGLWIIHQLNQTYIREYGIDAVITNIPKAYEQDSILIPLKIKVKGSGLKILLLENHLPPKVHIPFKELKNVNKKKLYSIRTESISDNDQFPVKIKILEIQPDTIRINFKTKKNK